MIQSVLLANLGAEINDIGYDELTMYDETARLGWLLLVHTEPGGPVIGNIIRCDPGTMGRGLFHFRTSPRDGRHSLAYPCSGEGLAAPVLPPLPALCAFFRAVRAEIAAGRAPDLAALTLLHLGVAQVPPPVEIRPGDREIRLDFDAPSEGDDG